MRPSVDIIIASYEQDDSSIWDLVLCLETVNRFTDLPFRILLERSKDSAAANRNRGLGRSTSPYICFLDDDAWVTPNWCSTLVETLETFPEAGMVAPKIKLETGRIFCAGVGFTPPDTFFPIGWNSRDDGDHPVLSEPFALPTTCLMVRRSVIEIAGGFDEEYLGSQWEDIDYYMKLRQTPFRGFINRIATVYHRNSYRVPQDGINKQRFLSKWAEYVS